MVIVMTNMLQHEMRPLFGHEEVTPLPTERVLESEEQVQVDLETPLADSQEVQRKLGIRGSIVATVNAGGKDFLIIDVRGTQSNRDFVIADETFSTQDRIGFKGVLEDSPVIIGREHYTDRFTYPATVSRDHFEILYENEGLFIRNLRPTNTTTVTAHLASEQQPCSE